MRHSGGVGENAILVLGATGQQGGSVVTALRNAGWSVRAMVRDPATARAVTLAASGVEVVRGDLGDPVSLQRAMVGLHGVFSVQPSSGQLAATVSDDDEVTYGIRVANLAVEAGVQHLVYTSSSAVSGAPTGIGHFDSKAVIEAHVRELPLATTILRPATFMELLPDFVLQDGELRFFVRPDAAMQFIAVRDIGLISAVVFAERERFRGTTLEIAGDACTGEQIARSLSRALSRPIRYQRFSDTVLEESPVLRSITRLVDDGPLAGAADLSSLRRDVPTLLTLDDWCRGPGRDALQRR